MSTIESLPSWQLCNAQNDAERRLGIEIELAGLTPDIMAGIIQALYGGEVVPETALEYRIRDTRFGDFMVELDASYLKQLAEKKAMLDKVAAEKGEAAEVSLLDVLPTDLLTRAAEQLVPWEIVAPPVPFSAVADLEEMVTRLRNAGAMGTRHAMQYAFGVHLNPELPDLSPATIINYLRAYFCLYDWIVFQDQTDLTRKLTTYIKHFDRGYIQRIIAWDYRPDQAQMIDDYLVNNPTRNRSLDMLPLFAHLDEARVKRVVNDPRIKSRPTFHYRLPNCDIDNPLWNLGKPWAMWLEVERLVSDEARLQQLCEDYQYHLNRLMHGLDDRWVRHVDASLGVRE